jgi:hypothetical protein
MPLKYLMFDASDDGEGHGSWEAMAWAKTNSPGPRGPLDAGGVWDADQHTQTDGDWTTVTLTVAGPWAWGEEMLAQLTP